MLKKIQECHRFEKGYISILWREWGINFEFGKTGGFWVVGIKGLKNKI